MRPMRATAVVALISPAYFERLWTVFELATFCRAHRERLVTVHS